MLDYGELLAARIRASEALADAGIALTDDEHDALEIADFGLSHLDQTGLQIVVYVNTARVCAKELVMFPRQICPEHRHPPFGDSPGKEETFRCRKGMVYLYTHGEPTSAPLARVPQDGVFTAWHQVVLRPGEQFTIAPNTLHWFQAADEGAILSEFSTQSRDDLDVFSDPRIRRETQMSET
jgi:D-lyxose ketol-isomerase